MNRTRMAKGRCDFVHIFRQVHHSEIRKVAEKAAMKEVRKAHQKLTGKSLSGEAKRPPCIKFKKGCCPKGRPRNYWHAPECFFLTRNCSRMQVRRTGGAYKHAAESADEQPDSATIAIYTAASDERQMQLRDITRIRRPNSE